MTKPAKTISLRDREAIADIRRNSEEKSLQDQLSELRLEFRGVTHSVYARLSQLELENYHLRNTLAAIQTGVRTSTERREALACAIADCGKGADNAD